MATKKATEATAIAPVEQEQEPQVMVDENGYHCLSLLDGTVAKMRSPKGKDLRLIESYAAQEDATNIGLLFRLISSLIVVPEGLTEAVLDEMDMADIEALTGLLKSFRSLGKYLGN